MRDGNNTNGEKYIWALGKTQELPVLYPTQQTVQMERVQMLMEYVMKHLMKMSILFKSGISTPCLFTYPFFFFFNLHFFS